MLDSLHPRRRPPKKPVIFAVVIVVLAGAAALTYLLASPKPGPEPEQNIVRRVLPGLPLPAPKCAGGPCPAEILDLSNWKVTLPERSAEDPEEALDILQPELSAYAAPPWFTPTSDGKGVVFRAPVNAPTTANSEYPRSELREMKNGGTKTAFWPTKTGTHTLFLDQAITAVPKNKPEVVAGQIHGDDDDLITVRLDHPKLYLARGKSNLKTLDENYALGKRFTVRFAAQGGKIAVYYNGSAAPVHVLDKKVDEAYFKAGAYTQSNCEAEDSASLCSSENYGEVVIYDIKVTHTR